MKLPAASGWSIKKIHNKNSFMAESSYEWAFEMKEEVQRQRIRNWR